MASGFFPRTNFSKILPHLWHAYSKIGIGLRYPLFGLSGVLGCPGPGRGLAAQVNREAPGIRGNTRNQTARTNRKIRILPISPIIRFFVFWGAKTSRVPQELRLP